MSIAGSKLQYLFTAVYKNGTTFQQNTEDVSAKEPGRSAFFDVDQSKLQQFILAGPQDAGKKDQHTYRVDLTDGHFEVDGVPFFFHFRRFPMSFRLIFFRLHREHRQGDLKSNEILGEASECHYRLGWVAYNPLMGEDMQRVMEID